MFYSLIYVLLVSCFCGIHSEVRTWYYRRYKYVNTEHGKIMGHLARDGNYFAFLGIPYAAPPTGELRFQEPKPLIPWKGILNATRTVQCPQPSGGEEDCLILNVFTPRKVFLPQLLPVLVHIHGGFFKTGSGPIRGIEPLIKQDIIVVTINYRLSALGFLCVGTQQAPGNAGLKDQVAALMWIQYNIIFFGGDPKLVTIHGVDAGASSVEYLMLSKMGDGLFKNAIMESGSASSVYAIDANPLSTARNFAKLLNFTSIDKFDSLLDQYKNASANKLSLAAEKYSKYLTDGTTGFAPCVEKQIRGIEPFINMSPHEILASDDYEHKPLLVIYVTLEGLYVRSNEYNALNYKQRLDSDFEEFLPADLDFYDEKQKKAVAKRVYQFYFGNKTIGDNTIVEYLDYFGDTIIMNGLLESVKIHATHQNPVYLMEFVYRGGAPSTDVLYEALNVAGHGDPTKYVFLDGSATKDMDNVTVERMTSLFGNFVKYSTPTPRVTSLNPVIWQPFKPSFNCNAIMFLNYDYHILEKSQHFVRKQLWDDIYRDFRRTVKPVDPKRFNLANTTFKLLFV